MRIVYGLDCQHLGRVLRSNHRGCDLVGSDLSVREIAIESADPDVGLDLSSHLYTHLGRDLGLGLYRVHLERGLTCLDVAEATERMFRQRPWPYAVQEIIQRTSRWSASEEEEWTTSRVRTFGSQAKLLGGTAAGH